MTSQIVEFLTPENVFLTGLQLGNPRSETCYIFIHGLGGNVFSNRGLADLLMDETSSVFPFSNRGHDLISRIKKIDKRKKKGTVSFIGGAAHEVFSECVDDIEGAVQFAKSQGAKHVILVGHSTGSQKAIYYLSKKDNQRKIHSVILLSALSDFAVTMSHTTVEDYKSLLKISEALVMQGSEHTLLPASIWPALADAQRFLSLTTPTSEEEIFSYYDPDKKSIFSNITLPLLVVFGDDDEYRDRPVKQIVEWFDTHQNSSDYSSEIVSDGTHGFDGIEKEVARIIKNFYDSSKSA